MGILAISMHKACIVAQSSRFNVDDITGTNLYHNVPMKSTITMNYFLFCSAQQRSGGYITM